MSHDYMLCISMYTCVVVVPGELEPLMPAPAVTRDSVREPHQQHDKEVGQTNLETEKRTPGRPVML